MNKDQNPISSKIQDLTEEQKLELFKVEELETRLEMAAASSAELASSNGVCWLGGVGESAK